MLARDHGKGQAGWLFQTGVSDIWEAEAGGLKNVPGQAGLQSEIPFSASPQASQSTESAVLEGCYPLIACD